MKEIIPREAFGKFKPEPCVFVIAFDRANNRPSGMVAGWSTKCSYDPPMYAVCLSMAGYTHKLIEKTGEFVVAVPNKELTAAVEFFGSTHGKETDKFKESGIEMEAAVHVNVPLIKKATLNLECRVEQKMVVGDHTIFIGRVLAAHHNEGGKVLMNMGKEDEKRVFEEF